MNRFYPLRLFAVGLGLALGLLASGCDLLGITEGEETTHLYPVKLNGEWGYINQEGRMVIEPQFQVARAFEDGLAAVRTSWRWGYIDDSGELVISNQYEDAKTFSEGLAAVRVDGRWGYIDRKGNFVLNPQYTAARPFSEERAFIRTSDWRWEYINGTGQVQRTGTTPRLEEVEDAEFSGGLALIRTREDQFGFIDKTGEPVIPPQFSAARSFSDGRAAIKISDRWGFIDKEQKTVISPQYISAASFSEDLAPVRPDGNQWGYADEKGAVVIAAQYDEARPFHDGRAAVLQSGKWGFIDTKGNAVVRAQFDAVDDFHGGLARVRVDVGEEAQRYGYVDRAGRYVWFPTD